MRALINGYVLFRVNGRLFLLYSSAKRYWMSLKQDTEGEIVAEGYHLLHGWLGFYCRYIY